MDEGLIVRLQPTGPWRFGSESGAIREVGEIYHSDSVFSAVTHAMRQLGELDTWLRATAEEEGAPAVSVSSCYPWQDEDLFVLPPRHLWPPVSPAMASLRNARFLPIRLLPKLFLGEELREEHWSVDAPSRCLISRPPDGAPRGPYRTAVRSMVPVDRLSGLAGRPRRVACVEFGPNAGLWLAVSFASPAARDRWAVLVEAAFRLLADTGFGGLRSIGWGRSAQPEFTLGSLRELLLPEISGKPAPVSEEGAEGAARPTGYWLLSLFRPGGGEDVNWNSGVYSLVTRGGRVESDVSAGQEKKMLRMVAEGSVLVAGNPLHGSAANVAPDGFPHPVYRYGRPVTLPVPLEVGK